MAKKKVSIEDRATWFERYRITQCPVCAAADPPHVTVKREVWCYATRGIRHHMQCRVCEGQFVALDRDRWHEAAKRTLETRAREIRDSLATAEAALEKAKGIRATAEADYQAAKARHLAAKEALEALEADPPDEEDILQELMA